MQQLMPRHIHTVERKEERIKPKKRELHELPYKEIVKSRTVTADSFLNLC